MHWFCLRQTRCWDDGHCWSAVLKGYIVIVCILCDLFSFSFSKHNCLPTPMGSKDKVLQGKNHTARWVTYEWVKTNMSCCFDPDIFDQTSGTSEVSIPTPGSVLHSRETAVVVLSSGGIAVQKYHSICPVCSPKTKSSVKSLWSHCRNSVCGLWLLAWNFRRKTYFLLLALSILLVG